MATQVPMIRNVLLDGSGTTMDPHVIAPALAFVETLKRDNVNIPMELARGPMGNVKSIHQRKLYATPEVKDQYLSMGRPEPIAADSDRIFDIHFNEIQNDILRRPVYHTLLSGVKSVIHKLQDDGIKVGFITGFMRSNVEVIKEAFEEQGVYDITYVAGDDIPDELGCRPSPHMVWECLRRMCATGSSYETLGVDDTVNGIGTINRAGAWSMAVYADSNYTNVDSHEQWDSFSQQEKDERRLQSLEQLKAQSGAHYIAPNLTYLPMVLNDINMRMHNPDNRNLPQSSMGFRDSVPFYRKMVNGLVWCRI